MINSRGAASARNSIGLAAVKNLVDGIRCIKIAADNDDESFEREDTDIMKHGKCKPGIQRNH